MTALRFGTVCSGIGAPECAWAPLGWHHVFASEIAAFPRSVLQHHFPGVPIHGDFTTIEADTYGPIDLLGGGTPCQDFSIAGLRLGLAGERGNLALEYLLLARRLRPRWLVWENVPGVLSSNGGRDFGAFLGGMAELGYGWAYWVLDARYFGVAQRRRRVFVVGYLGDWRRAASVLFEPESMRGDPPPRRKARQAASGRAADGAGGWRGQHHEPGAQLGTASAADEAAAIAGTLQGSYRSACSATGQDAAAGLLIPEAAPTEFLPQSSRVYMPGGVSPTLQATGSRAGQRAPMVADIAGTLTVGQGKRSAEDPERGLLVPVAGTLDAAAGRSRGAGTPVSMLAFGGNNTSSDIDVAPSLLSQPSGMKMDFESETFAVEVAHTLRGEGHDASEDGSGRGVPLIAEPIAFDATIVAKPNNRSAYAPGSAAPAVIASGSMAVAEPIAFDTTQVTSPLNRSNPQPGEDITGTLRTHPRPGSNSLGGAAVAGRSVRRLMPAECETLQGFPDGWTRIRVRRYATKRVTETRPEDRWERDPDGKHWWLMSADAPRYMGIGNSMAVPVVEWIGRRIALAEAEIQAEAAADTTAAPGA